MDPIIKKLKTPEECEFFIKKYTELVYQARQKAIELRAVSHGNLEGVESELYKALYAYEEVLTRKNGRKTRAGRTWPMVNKYGIISAAERAVNRKIEPQVYKYLVEMGLQDLTFESVIVKYTNAFSRNVVTKANERLEKLKELAYKVPG